eukprot:scaffold113524_cov47-Phaeocystis_antarctica.AAC.1
MTVAGTVETFDAADFKLHLATLVGVEPAAVTLNVTAASVRVTATIRVVGEAARVVASVQALANNASALSLAAGVTIQSVDTPTVSVRLVVAPSPPPRSLPPPSSSPPPPSPSLPPPPPPPPSSPPLPPSSPPPCVNTDNRCKKRKCKKYSDAKKLKCKKTCNVCDGLPPSPPPSQPSPPSPPACEDNDISGLGSYWCKLNTQYATASASERFCNDERYKVKCKKTCSLCD